MTTRTNPTGVDDAGQRTHYDLLEVPPSATRSEIAEAYKRAQAAFAADSLAIDTLFTPEEARLVSERMETAFRVLGDVETRERYDQELAARGRGTDAAPSDEAQGAPHTTTAPLAEGASPRHGDSPTAMPGTECGENPVISSDQRVDGILAETTQCDGAAIRRLREARGVTVDQINLSTKISLMNLRFIEEDNLDALPAPVYLRGNLRQIALFLRVDADWVVAGYMARIETRTTGIR